MEGRALSALAALLGGLGIRWVLIGALAANRYRGSPRLTADVDLLLADAGPGLDALEAAAIASGWQVRRADPAGELLRLRHPEHGIADLLVAGTPYQDEAIRRARPEPLGEGDPIPVLTVEDVIVHKLIAGRSQDRADVESILATGVSFDEGYVERWARHWDLAEEWRALQRAFRVPG